MQGKRIVFYSSLVLLILSFLFRAEQAIGANKLNSETDISPSDSGKFIASLDSRWLVFDNKYDDFVPYYYSAYPLTTNLSAWIDAKSEVYLLQMPVNKGLCVYFNNKLYYYYSKPGVACINLTSIAKELKTRKLFLTLYEPNGQLPFSQTWLVNSVIKLPLQPSNSAGKPVFVSSGPISKPSFLFNEWSLFYVIVLVGLYIALKNFNPAQFSPIFQLVDYFSSETDIYTRSTHRLNNLFTLLLAIVNVLVISFMIWLAAEHTLLPALFQSLPMLKEWGLGKLLLLTNFVLIGIAYISFKVIVINSTTALFSLKKLNWVHLYEMLRFTTWLGIGVLILGLLTFGGGYLTTTQFIYGTEILILILFVLRGVKVAILLRAWGNYQRIYLFSYLCATEILPMLLVIRQVLDYQAKAGAL